MRTLRPRQLSKGDLIGIVSPASTVSDLTRIDRGIQYLERLGYCATVGASVTHIKGYLAGTDEERVADLHAMFADQRVKAIICARGGYGTPRLLSLLDYRLIRRNPKLLVGFSDITALQLAIWRKCRLVTFHGPMLAVDMWQDVDPYTEEMFWRLVSSPKPLGKVRFPENESAVTYRPGKSSGPLLGGNLSLIVSQMGTPFMPDLRQSVLCLEEVGEEPYRVDRMLMQIRNAGILSKVAAILTGGFTECEPRDLTAPSLTVEEVLRETAQKAGRPFLAGMPFGHVPRKMTIPFGVRARVDAGAGTVEFLHAAVRS